MSYKHPAVIIEEWKNMVLAVPTTSAPSKVADAFHPRDNPHGKWYYRKVGIAEGFVHDCALILNNTKIMSKTRIISVSGSMKGNLSGENHVFREIRKTMIRNFFKKEWSDYQKLERAYEEERKKNQELQDDYGRLLEENKMLKLENKKF